MDVVVERCAGLVVHRDNVVATVRVPSDDRRRWLQKTRTFKATLAGLKDLGEWLADFGVTLVGMEATGVYWKTVFYALESRFACWLLNAQHLRNVGGGGWGCGVGGGGGGQSNERTRAIQRLEKVLQDAGIKLTSVASQTYSKSARAILEALLAGVSNPEELAELAKARMRSKVPSYARP